jgi:polar amino acid transport system substrate-binding protein
MSLRGYILVAALTLSTLTHGETLTLGCDENLPPFSFIEGGQPRGIDVDVANEMARRLHLSLTIGAYPWKRVLGMLKRGAIQSAMSLFDTPERRTYVQYVGPIHYTELALFVAKDRSFEFQRTSDLFGRTIGINQGFTITGEIDDAIASGKLRVNEAQSTKQNIMLLKLGRIDGFIANLANTKYSLAEMNEDTITALPKVIQQGRPAYLVFSKSAPIENRDDLLKRMTTTLAAIHTAGTYDRIVALYLK